MNCEFDTALDECLALVRAGDDIETCLARYPSHASRLRPLLELAADVRALAPPAPAAAAREAGRARMLNALAQKRAGRPRASAFSLRGAARRVAAWFGTRSSKFKYVWQAAVTMIVVAMVIISGSVAASAASLPGDTLYPVKLAVQGVRVNLAFDAATRQQLEEQFEIQRRQDVQTVLEARRQTIVELQGILEQINESNWTVSGLSIALEPETTLVGQPRLGAHVAVRGYLPGDGSLVAIHLRVTEIPSPTPQPTARPSVTPRPTKPLPTLTAVLAPWKEPEPPSNPPRQPKPTRTLAPTVEPSPSHTAQPTPTSVPTHTSTPMPTRTLTPTLTYTPMPTYTPTLRPTSTHTPTLTPTPVPPPPPTFTPTPIPPPTVVPTYTSAPTSTVPPEPTPTDTPVPSDTPSTPVPTDTPDLTPTLEPTQTPLPPTPTLVEPTPTLEP